MAMNKTESFLQVFQKEQHYIRKRRQAVNALKIADEEDLPVIAASDENGQADVLSGQHVSFAEEIPETYRADPGTREKDEVLSVAIMAQGEQVPGAESPKEDRGPLFQMLVDQSKWGSVGLALSGGGIRSATFNLGVLQGLARQGVLKFCDYLSTVSGGGYIGSCLSSLLDDSDASVRCDHFPFRFDRQNGGDERKEVKWLRSHGKYLAEKPGILSVYFWRLIATYFSGLILTNLTTVAFVLWFGVFLHWSAGPMAFLPPYLFGLSGVLFVLLILGRAVASIGNPGFVKRQKLGLYWAHVIRVSVGFVALGGLIVMGQHMDRIWLWAGDSMDGLSVATALGLLAGLWRNKRVLGFVFRLSWVVLLPLFMAQFLRWAWLSDVFSQPAPILSGVPLSVFLGLILFVIGSLLNTNRINNHHFYRDRLSEAYIIKRQNDVIHSNEALPLSGLHHYDNGAPYHVINATLNVAGSKNRYLKGRGADFFLFSKFYCGAESTGYCATSLYENGETRLATAMAISGAAANPSMGTNTHAGLRFLMTLLNVRLNRWMPNPGQPTTPHFVFWPWYFVKEMFGKEKETDRLLNLSDGGHHENLGLYALIKRGCRFLIVSDAGADPDFTFVDLANAMRKVRIDMGVGIEIDLSDLRPDGKSTTHKHFAVGTIHYPNGVKGTLVYINTAIDGHEPEDVLGYRRKHFAFPDESTGDQFFGEDQFESYRKLGEISAREPFLKG